jgi:Spy/CpxP family protein refolding chaperone
MRTFGWACLATALALFWVSIAMAQPPGPGGKPFPPGPPPGPPPILMLLSEKSVQTDLKLTAAQNKKVNAAMTKQMMTMKTTFNLAPEQRDKKMQEIVKTSDQAADELLTADQKKRVKQISLQVQGGQAFTNPDVVKDLDLTDEQQTKIKAIHDGIGKQMGEMFKGKKLPPQAFQQKMTEIKKTADADARKVLTSEQASTWSEMTGTPFRGEIRMMPPMGFGPPPGFPPKQ